MIEIWKNVVGHEQSYEVSSLGRVRSLPKKTYSGTRILKAFLVDNQQGRAYLRVNLSKDGKMYTRKVHHLVCEAFHGKRPDGQETRHLDDDPMNNLAKNLRWGTRVENMADRRS